MSDLCWPSVFPVDDFLSRFPVFAEVGENGEPKYAQSYIIERGTRAMMHIRPSVPGMPMVGPYREYALFLMTAHLIELDDLDDNGENPVAAGTPFKATVGSVSIENTKQNSFKTDDWNYWLNQTKHGRELLAYLDVQAPLGVYIEPPCDSARDLI